MTRVAWSLDYRVAVFLFIWVHISPADDSTCTYTSLVGVAAMRGDCGGIVITTRRVYLSFDHGVTWFFYGIGVFGGGAVGIRGYFSGREHYRCICYPACCKGLCWYTRETIWRLLESLIVRATNGRYELWLREKQPIPPVVSFCILNLCAALALA